MAEAEEEAEAEKEAEGVLVVTDTLSGACQGASNRRADPPRGGTRPTTVGLPGVRSCCRPRAPARRGPLLQVGRGLHPITSLVRGQGKSLAVGLLWRLVEARLHSGERILRAMMTPNHPAAGAGAKHNDGAQND